MALMAPTETTGVTLETDPSTQKHLPAKSEIDLQALAERILHLLKQEARLDQERLGRGKPQGKKVTHGA